MASHTHTLPSLGALPLSTIAAAERSVRHSFLRWGALSTQHVLRVGGAERCAQLPMRSGAREQRGLVLLAVPCL